MAKKFKVLVEILNGSKLIEASAGTGKTYSVAILVLRLILEERIPIEKILMVTFTKAAVAELELRIRNFVRLAYRFASGKEINDSTIKKAVGDPDEQKARLLRNAIQSLDSLSVMTIHGFCQKTIGEFIFETDQAFDYEIVTDDSQLMTDESNRYLREVLNILNLETFEALYDDFNFEKFQELLRKHLLGMKFIDPSPQKGAEIEVVRQNIAAKKEALDTFVMGKFYYILNNPMGKNALSKDAEKGNVEEFKRRFRDQISLKDKPAGYFVNFAFMKDDFLKFETEIKAAEDEFVNYFYLDFLSRSTEEIKRLKQKRGYISYDDQIKTIHKALANESFKEKLAQKYQALFIDEFQDTDNYQYEIFSSVFSENSILFYIGDPKQSIYGWRGADLDTYKSAKASVGEDGVLTMNINYRSTKKMIDALNILLNPDDGFNMFKDDEISYINVGQGAINLGEMSDSGDKVLPVTIWNFDKDDFESNYTVVSQEIYRLLTTDAKIDGRKITPNDIGVLVRENKEGDLVKKALARLNIPSVKRDDTKVLKSDESQMISYLLKAVVRPNRGDINRALNSSYFGFNSTNLKTLDEDKHIEIFMRLNKTMTEEGVYNMISSFLTIYGVRARCMEDVSGQRVLTNINQIAEILHKIEKQSRYTADELVLWMERNSDEGEEYEQRIESDEDAVQISTIHKAKGLEYNIVFAPCLSMIVKRKLLEKGNVNDFKKEGEYFYTLNYNLLSAEDKNIFDTQKEQENRRLIYVALTRAVYKSYISLVPRTYRGKTVSSSLSEILDYCTGVPDLIEIKPMPKDDIEIIKAQYHPEVEKPIFTPKEKPAIEVKKTFGIYSFSGLSKGHHSAVFEKAELGEPGDYDQFIFQDLGRGASAGTALHNIFERLNFAESSSWEQTIREASKFYPKIINEERLGLLKQMINHIMTAELNTGEKTFKLQDVTNKQKLPELEFCFSLNKVNRAVINELLGEDADLGGESDIEGLMTGFIDLFFECNGKYYILDWKSNFLGNTTDNYNQDGMAEAMKGNNYHLQYFIYTLAMKRYLEVKLHDFDYVKHFGGVIYVFLRGVRNDEHGNGIFFAKPTKEKVMRLEELFNN